LISQTYVVRKVLPKILVKHIGKFVEIHEKYKVSTKCCESSIYNGLFVGKTGCLSIRTIIQTGEWIKFDLFIWKKLFI